jgi:hypothetical protein
MTPKALAAAGANSSSSAQRDVAHSLAEAKQAGTVRITVQFFTGSTTGKVVQDSSLTAGKQTVAIGNELASVVLLRSSAYISGNNEGLTSFFGLPSAMVSALIGRWASLQPGDSPYSAVTANVTLRSALANVTPSGTLIEGKRSMVDGQLVRSIAGSLPGGGGHMLLFVAINKRSLPVEAVESGGNGASGQGEIVTFSHWGETLRISAPHGAIPFSALQTIASAN